MSGRIEQGALQVLNAFRRQRLMRFDKASTTSRFASCAQRLSASEVNAV